MYQPDTTFSIILFKDHGSLTGDDVFQGPMWIRPKSLLQNPLTGYHQIVGHTRLKNIHLQTQNGMSYFFTDTTMRQYLVIDTQKGTYRIMTKEPYYLSDR